MAKIQFPLQFERQYSSPIDIDMVFETTISLNNYLTNEKRYAGMIVTCKEQEGKIFVLNNAKNAWLTFNSSFDSSSYEKTDNRVTSWSSPTSDSKYPSEKLVKGSLDELENKVESVSDLSPYHYEGTFHGDVNGITSFDDLIVGYEDLKDVYAFNETKLRGSYFICSAECDILFAPTYSWSAAAGGSKTSAITYTWAAPYDLVVGTLIGMKPGDIISILDFSYDAVNDTISTIIKVEKNLAETLNDSIPDISLNDNTATEGKYISKIEVDSVDSHKINITKADLPDISTKVDKEEGKVLSDNNFTTTLKDKVLKIITTGDGTKLLSDDGTYKSGGTGIELKAIGSAPTPATSGDYYYNTTDKKIYKYGTSWSEWLGE